jgi:prepilin-type N-terminal cleavage/methylation domain-containing protein
MRYGKLQNGTRNAERSTRCLVHDTQYAVSIRQYAALSPLPSPLSTLPSPLSRRAVTLIEMLIVLFIISLLAVAALRALPGDDQKPREAARMLNVYIATAKANAAATGRPAGVILRPSSTTTYAAYSSLIEQCEVPPTYAGDTLNAVVQAQDWTYKLTGGNLVKYDSLGRTVVKIRVRVNDFSNNIMRFGDQVQLNGQGPIYTVLRDQNTLGATDTPSTLLPDFQPDANQYLDFSAGTDTNPADGWIDNYYLTLVLDPLSSQPVPWPKSYNGVWSDPIIFKIIRQPEKSAIAPLQLPTGAGIDLPFSGVDNAYPPAPTTSLIGGATTILFSPNGSVDSLYIGTTKYKPTQTIHLLVGKLTVNSEPDNNWFDLKNIIVSVNPQTGTVSTNPVYPPYYDASLVVQPLPNPPFPNDPPAAQNQFDPSKPPAINYLDPYQSGADTKFLQALFYSRKFAREAQTMGGKR